MARANRRGGFGALRGATNNRSVISNEFPNNPQYLDRCIIKTTNQKYYWNKPTTEWIPLFGAGGGGNLGGLVYHNDTNTTAVSTNVEVGTVDVTMAFDGSLVVTGTFVGTASTAMTITSLIKLDTVTQHTAVQYISGAVDDTVSFSVVLEGIEAGDYTVSVDMSANTGTFTLDASEQHLYALTYYDAIIGGSGGGATAGYALGGWLPVVADTDEYIPDVWTSKTNMSPSRYKAQSTDILSKIYICGGRDSSFAYLVDTDEYIPDTWTAKTNMSTNVNDGTMSTINDIGYVFCGLQTSTRSNSTFEYNPDTWTTKTSSSTNREGPASMSLNNLGYVVAGFSGVSYLQSTEEYNPDTWTAKTNCPSPARVWLCATEISSSGYIFGGDSNGGGAGGELQDTDEYTPDTWTSKTNMPSPARTQFGACNISGKAYVFGGDSNSTGSGGYLQDADEYVVDTWTSITDIPAPARGYLSVSSI